MKKLIAAAAMAALLLSACTGSKYAAGDGYLAAGDLEEAISVYTLIVENNPEDFTAMIKLGDAHLENKDLENARETYAKALDLRPGDEQTVEKLKKVIYDTGMQQVSDERYGAAVKTFEGLLDSYPDYRKALEPLATSYAKLGRLEKARKLYGKVLETDPENSAAKAGMAMISQADTEADKVYNQAKNYYKKKMYYEAADVLKAIVEKNAENVEAKYFMHMAQGKFLLGRSSLTQRWKAIEEFGYAITLRPDDPEAYFLMAQAYEKKAKNEFDDPINMYKKVIEVSPDSDYAKQSQAKVKELTEKKKKWEKFNKKKKGKG